MSNPIKDCWNSRSDEYYKGDYENFEIIRDAPDRAFPIGLYPILRKYFPDLRGKRVLVPSSGDNVAAFGLHLLGARVTSTDLAERQIEAARKAAAHYGWDVEFMCRDTMELDGVEDGAYDLVYTSNGVHVWINDLPKMYGNIHRVLKPGGYSVFFETHPMIRPFNNDTYEVKIKKDYDDIFSCANDEVPNYLWRTKDFVNAVAGAGLTIREMLEFHSLREDLTAHNYLYIREDDKNRFKWPGDTYDWHNNPWAALPQCIGMVSQKV